MSNDTPAFDASIFDGYEDNFKPEHQGFRPDLTAIPDGPADFEIADAVLDNLKGNPVCRMGLKVNGGAVLEHIWWLTTQESFNSFAADLVIFGVPAAKPLHDGVPAAVAKLPGIKFKGAKRTYLDGKGVTRAALNVLCRIVGNPMPSAPAALGPKPAPADNSAENVNKIPF